MEANTDIGVFEAKYLRHIVIARLPRIQMLNHTKVSRGERGTAERQYILKLVQDLRKG